MSPDRLLREPWRLALFFVAVFGMLILCLATILWQQEVENKSTRRTQQLILIALQKSDRNNQTTRQAIETTRKVYEAGRKTRGKLTAMVADEKRMNLVLIRMNRQEIAYQRVLVRLLRRLERRRR